MRRIDPRRTPPRVDVLAAAAKAANGEALTPEEEVALGRRMGANPVVVDSYPADGGQPHRVETATSYEQTLEFPTTRPVDEQVDQAVAGHQGARVWVSPQAAALMPPDERPDVTGLITLDRTPDMRNPHKPGVTFWLYRWWGRDATTGKLYLLYVGETEQLPVDRLIQHLTSRTAPARHFKHLLFAWEVDPRVFPSKQAALAAEATAIRNEYPARNIKGQVADNHRWAARRYRQTVRLRAALTPGLIVALVLVAAIGGTLTYLTWGVHAQLSVWWTHLILVLVPFVLASAIVFGIRGSWRAGRSKPSGGKPRRGGR